MPMIPYMIISNTIYCHRLVKESPFSVSRLSHEWFERGVPVPGERVKYSNCGKILQGLWQLHYGEGISQPEPIAQLWPVAPAALCRAPTGSQWLVERAAGRGILSGTFAERYITDAIFYGRRDALYKKLTALAYFLATLHNRTANGFGVNFQEDCVYLDSLVHKLVKKHYISCEDESEFAWLRDRWHEQPRMWQDQQVYVHGDATPTNFLFRQGLSVTAIDLERMKRADRAFDVGRITGELQHFFLQHTGNKYQAEPFIGHFLWEYACHFPDRYSAFRSICGRVPYQMGFTLLRIARNSWVSSDYRYKLIEEAKLTLRSYWKSYEVGG